MRGNITRRGKSSWRLKFDLDPDPITGARRFRTVTIRGKRQDAEAELARLINDAHKGTLVDASNVTVEAYLWGWLDGKHGLSPVSVERYREIIARGIVRRHHRNSKAETSPRSGLALGDGEVRLSKRWPVIRAHRAP